MMIYPLKIHPVIKNRQKPQLVFPADRAHRRLQFIRGIGQFQYIFGIKDIYKVQPYLMGDFFPVEPVGYLKISTEIRSTLIKM
jgi:hypothetical protein